MLVAIFHSATSLGNHLKITGIHTRSTIGIGVPGSGVRSSMGGIGTGVPGVRVRLRSGSDGVDAGVGVTVERKRVRVRAFNMALIF